MKKAVALLLCLSVAALCGGCASVQADEMQRFSHQFFGTFDTVVQVIGYQKDEAVFTRLAQDVQALFGRLNKVYDGYNAYEGVHNLYYMNQEAAKGPVTVEPELMELLLYCRQMQPELHGTVNIALGAVLRLWHDFRDEAEVTETPALPTMEALREAAAHTDFDQVVLDTEKGTVHYIDPLLKIDLGSVAKGYATELAAQYLLASEMPSFIISAGGNVRAGDPPQDGRLRWGIGVENPDASVFTGVTEGQIERLFFANSSAVTSGDYQRYVELNGMRYHHIISPQTLMPSTLFRGVTVVTEDSGYADLLSTTLFLLPYEEGRAFAESLDGVEVLWALPDGTVEMTDGMAVMAYSHGATAK